YALTLGTLLGQKRSEERLRQERDLLRTLIDSLPDYILVKDREGCVVISNTSHAQTTDLMPDELITKAAFDALPVDVSNRLRTEDQEIMQSGKAIINLEREVIGKDKKPETILITKIPLRDATGTITGLIAVGRDITERKQLEAQSIELANKRERIVILQRFIDDMSHDFRTPLSIIRNSLYLLQRIDDAEKQQMYTQRAEQQISRLDTLLDELLQMKNLDAQEVQFDLKLTDINSLLAQLVHDYQPVALPKRITLEFVSADDACFAEIDHQEFIRAVAKLLDNAIAYTPEQGTVTIHTATQAGLAVISVQDSGIGIAKDDLPHIFERFYRADQARSTTSGSSGLGLSIVQKIVEAHNGIISVDSLVDQGSTFTLKLPVEERS
ncbi:MAG: ATP-binding protein, partial [Chloroflexota bacterium]